MVRKKKDRRAGVCAAGEAKGSKTDGGDRGSESLETRIFKLRVLRDYFKLADREEWWWLMDQTIDEIARQLNEFNFVVMDGFLTQSQADLARASIVDAHQTDRLKPGLIINAHKNYVESGSEIQGEKSETLRNDYLAWVTDSDPGFSWTADFTLKLGTLMSELGDKIPELKAINARQQVMVTCYPPGARYVAHVDNNGKNPQTKPRVISIVYHLNPDWHDGDGGELAVYAPHASPPNSKPIAVSPPLHNRLYLFFSDYRVPHEVLPANKARYACVTWFLAKPLGSTGAEFANVNYTSAEDFASASADSLASASIDSRATALPNVTCGSSTPESAHDETVVQGHQQADGGDSWRPHEPSLNSDARKSDLISSPDRPGAAGPVAAGAGSNEVDVHGREVCEADRLHAEASPSQELRGWVEERGTGAPGCGERGQVTVVLPTPWAAHAVDVNLEVCEATGCVRAVDAAQAPPAVATSMRYSHVQLDEVLTHQLALHEGCASFSRKKQQLVVQFPWR